MIRKIIHIDEERCNGCGACASACHEGAIGMVGGKAKLLRDDHCDGLGDCLPACPTGAITFVEREAAAYALAQRILSQPLGEMVVTPREIDQLVAELSQVIGMSLNLALQPQLSREEILMLTNEGL